MKRTLLTLMITLSLSATAQASSYFDDFKDKLIECEPKRGGNDYRRNDDKIRHLKRLVEGAHFTEGVRRGLYGNAGSLESDLNYVLNKFPNHPQALLVMARHWSSDNFQELRRKDRKDYRWPTKECYMMNALNLFPDDPSVHLVIAIFYHEQKNFKVAHRHYQSAVKFGPRNAEAHYNLGLFYADMEQWDKAREHAKIAFQLQYPLSGLKDRLVKADAWDEEEGKEEETR